MFRRECLSVFDEAEYGVVREAADGLLSPPAGGPQAIPAGGWGLGSAAARRCRWCCPPVPSMMGAMRCSTAAGAVVQKAGGAGCAVVPAGRRYRLPSPVDARLEASLPAVLRRASPCLRPPGRGSGAACTEGLMCAELAGEIPAFRLVRDPRWSACCFGTLRRRLPMAQYQNSACLMRRTTCCCGTYSICAVSIQSSSGITKPRWARPQEELMGMTYGRHHHTPTAARTRTSCPM